MKKVYFNEETRKIISEGVDLIADAVKTTLGPKGKYVGILKPDGTHHVTKDGVTVARFVESDDPVKNFAIHVVQEASAQTADIAGDGTTTATVLAQAIYNYGLKYVSAGANAVAIQRGLQKSGKAICEKIQKLAHPVRVSNTKQLKRVATISANNDVEIGKKVAEAVKKVGKDGVVTVEEYQGTEITTEYSDGMELNTGYISQYFVTDPSTNECIIDNPYILITEHTISSIRSLVPIIDKLIKAGEKNLVIMANNVTGDALTNLILNRAQGVINVCCVKTPYYNDLRKEILQDICALTGATPITEDLGRKVDENLSISDLGRARRFVSGRDKCVIVEGKGDQEAIQTRILELRNLVKSAKTAQAKKKYSTRLAKLTGGIAIIKVGAPTEVEVKEIKDRLDDAICATKAALEQGIVAGGGVTYVNAIAALDSLELEGDEAFAKDILRVALKEPMKQILQNAGVEFVEVIIKNSYENPGIGFNALTSEENINMIEHGIIDPAKVACQAVENSISVASQLLATPVIVINYEEEKYDKN